MCFLVADAIFTGSSDSSDLIQMSALISSHALDVSSTELFMYIDHEIINKEGVNENSGLVSFALDDLMIVKEIKRRSGKDSFGPEVLFSKDGAAQVIDHLALGISRSLVAFGKSRRVPFVAWDAARVVDHLESYGVTKNLLIPIELQHALFGLRLEAVGKESLIKDLGLSSEMDTMGFCRAVSGVLKKSQGASTDVS